MACDRYNLRENLYLIGDVDSQIVGNKLPSNKQVLKLLFFNTRKLKLTIRESASLVANEVLLFWGKAGIPTKNKDKIVVRIEELHQQYRNVQKRKEQDCIQERESKFKSNLDLLFDIASPPEMLNVLSADKLQFLENQRKPSREGFIGDIKTIYDEISADEIHALIEERRNRQHQRENEVIGEKTRKNKFYLSFNFFFIFR